MSKGDLHERFEAHGEIKISSERSFGIVFAAEFAIIGLAPLIGGGGIRFWSLGVALAFLVTSFVAPEILGPLNRAWAKFGMVLHHVMNPLIMGLIFFLAVTPIALVMRLMGKDPLRLRLDRDAKSYWIERTPPGPAPETMSQQF